MYVYHSCPSLSLCRYHFFRLSYAGITVPIASLFITVPVVQSDVGTSVPVVLSISVPLLSSFYLMSAPLFLMFYLLSVTLWQPINLMPVVIFLLFDLLYWLLSSSFSLICTTTVLTYVWAGVHIVLSDFYTITSFYPTSLAFIVLSDLSNFFFLLFSLTSVCCFCKICRIPVTLFLSFHVIPLLLRTRYCMIDVLILLGLMCVS